MSEREVFAGPLCESLFWALLLVSEPPRVLLSGEFEVIPSLCFLLARVSCCFLDDLDVLSVLEVALGSEPLLALLPEP
jgi:hypothetical protein